MATFGIDYDAITKEQFVNIIDVLKLSKYMKSSTNQRGKARAYQPHGKGKTETQISRKTRHTQPLKLNMACFFVDQSCLTDAHFALFG